MPGSPLIPSSSPRAVSGSTAVMASLSASSSTGCARPPASRADSCSKVMICSPCRRPRAASSRSSRILSRLWAITVWRSAGFMVSKSSVRLGVQLWSELLDSTSLMMGIALLASSRNSPTMCVVTLSPLASEDSAHSAHRSGTRESQSLSYPSRYFHHGHQTELFPASNFSLSLMTSSSCLILSVSSMRSLLTGDLTPTHSQTKPVS